MFYIIVLFRRVSLPPVIIPVPVLFHCQYNKVQLKPTCLPTYETPFKATKYHIKSPDIVTVSSLHLKSRPIPNQILGQFLSFFQHCSRFGQAGYTEYHLGAENHTLYTNKAKIPHGFPKIRSMYILETTFSGFYSYKPFVLLDNNRLLIWWSRAVHH